MSKIQKMESRDNQAKILITLLINKAIEGLGSIRFNELLRTMKSYGYDISKPALSRNLKKLMEKGIVKREEKGKQNVIYYLSTPQDPALKAEFFRFEREILEWCQKNAEIVKKYNFDEISGMLILLVQLKGLELLRLDLKYIFGFIEKKEYIVRSTMKDSFYKIIYGVLLQTCKENIETYRAEVEDALKNIGQIITRWKKLIFENR